MTSASLLALEELATAKYVVIDTESTGNEPGKTKAHDVRWHPDFRLRGMAFAARNSAGEITSAYFDLESPTAPIEAIQTFLGQDKHWIAHNVKFDWQAILRHLGCNLWDTPWYCTMQMATLVNENFRDKGLDFLGKIYVKRGKENSKLQDDIIDNFGWSFVPHSILGPYCASDAVLTLELFEKLLPDFRCYE